MSTGTTQQTVEDAIAAAGAEPVNVVEVVTFRLRPGVTNAQFQQANEGMTRFVRHQTGFLYRSLCRPDAEGYWRDIIYWQDQAAAAAASAAFETSPLTREAMACIDSESVAMQHFPVHLSSCSAES